MDNLIKTEAKRILSLKKITHLEYNFCVLNRVAGFSTYNYEWSVNDCKYIKIK